MLALTLAILPSTDETEAVIFHKAQFYRQTLKNKTCKSKEVRSCAPDIKTEELLESNIKEVSWKVLAYIPLYLPLYLPPAGQDRYYNSPDQQEAAL